MIVRKFYC